jgi:hypothetical protein
MIEENKSHRLDPDPVAIYGLIVSGLSLLLALESKIENRRHNERLINNKQAQRSCKHSLITLRNNLPKIDLFIRKLRSMGEIQQVPDRKTGVGAFRLYFNEEQVDYYNRTFNSTLQAISAINKVVTKIPLDKLLIPPMEINNLSQTLNALRNSANEFFTDPLPEIGADTASSMSRLTGSLISQIEHILDIDPPSLTLDIEI